MLITAMLSAAGCQDENFPTSMGSDHNTAALQCKLLLMDMLRDVRAYLLAQSPYESLAEQVTLCVQPAYGGVRGSAVRRQQTHPCTVSKKFSMLWAEAYW